MLGVSSSNAFLTSLFLQGNGDGCANEIEMYAIKDSSCKSMGDQVIIIFTFVTSLQFYFIFIRLSNWSTALLFHSFFPSLHPTVFPLLFFLLSRWVGGIFQKVSLRSMPSNISVSSVFFTLALPPPTPPSSDPSECSQCIQSDDVSRLYRCSVVQSPITKSLSYCNSSFPFIHLFPSCNPRSHSNEYLINPSSFWCLLVQLS